MTNSSLRQAGHYALKSFKITNFKRTKTIDFSRLIHTWSITESMSAGSVRGNAVVYDALNLLAEFPLLGEELVDIVYSDFFDIERRETFFLYAISNVQNPDENSGKIQRYTLNFVSPAKFYTENTYMMKTYKPVGSSSRVSDYVKELYDEYYKRLTEQNGLKVKDIVVEETQGAQSLVIPNMTPEQAMHFFSRKAYSSASNTQMFRFFENRDKYYFVSNDYMLKAGKNFTGYGEGLVDPGLAKAANMSSNPVPIFRRNYMPDLSADRQIQAMYDIIAIDFGERVNTIEDINSGAYKRKAVEIDILNGAIIQYPYDHLTEFDEKGQSLIHNREFVDTYMTKEDIRFIVKDYATTGANSGKNTRYDTFYQQLHNEKRSNAYHYTKNKINMTIFGRNNIFAGSVIDLDLNYAKDVVKQDKEKSGRYIVESIENVFYENTYRQKLVISRSGIGV